MLLWNSLAFSMIQQMQQLIEHVKQTGTADVLVEDEKKQYEAAVNGNSLLLYEKDSNLNDFRKAFEEFQSPPYNPTNDKNE